MVSDYAACADSELFALVRRGDRTALGCLVDRHKDGLVNYLTRLNGCRETAEDMAQETFLRLVERTSNYVEQGKLVQYMYRIATNLVRSKQRRERRWRLLTPMLVSSNGHGYHAPAQHRSVARRELAASLSAALATLPLHYRTPLVLRDVEDWSYREIAEMLGCREGTVKSRIHRGRELLRQQLESEWPGELS